MQPDADGSESAKLDLAIVKRLATALQDLKEQVEVRGATAQMLGALRGSDSFAAMPA